MGVFLFIHVIWVKLSAFCWLHPAGLNLLIDGRFGGKIGLSIKKPATYFTTYFLPLMCLERI